MDPAVRANAANNWQVRFDNYAGDATPNKVEQYNIANDCYKANSVPMNFRKVIQAQLSYEGINKNNSLGDNRSIRVKLFMNATLGTACTVLARLIRLVFKTAFLVFTTLYHAAKGSRYGIEGEVKEHLKRYAEEWVDVGVTALSCLVSVARTFTSRSAFSGATNSIRDYYFSRIDRREAHENIVQQAIVRYQAEVAKARDVREGQFRDLALQGEAKAANAAEGAI